LNTAINKIREVLGDTAESPRFVETLPRRGYRFIAPVEDIRIATEPAEEVGRGTGYVSRWRALDITSLDLVRLGYFGSRRGHLLLQANESSCLANAAAAHAAYF
jgi:hypothetical protein